MGFFGLNSEDYDGCSRLHHLRFTLPDGLFDKAVVIGNGDKVYFNPRSGPRAYFESIGHNYLPRQSAADYLSGCTGPNERRFAPGWSTVDAPSTQKALEEASRASRYHIDTMNALEKYRIHQTEERHDQEAFLMVVRDAGVRRKVFHP